MFRVERIYRPASTLSTRVYLPRNRYAISTLAVHFHRCRMFAEYRRVRRAMICFIHFSHSKFITFRKTDSFIPRVLKLFSTTVLDINDYGKTRIDSRTNFASIDSHGSRSSAKIKCCICGDSKSDFTTAKRTLSPALLRRCKPKVHNSARLNERHAFPLQSLTNLMRFRVLLKSITINKIANLRATQRELINCHFQLNFIAYHRTQILKRTNFIVRTIYCLLRINTWYSNKNAAVLKDISTDRLILAEILIK